MLRLGPVELCGLYIYIYLYCIIILYIQNTIYIYIHMVGKLLVGASLPIQAMFNLAVAYSRGDGTAVDSKEAVRWYRRAAEMGHVMVARYQIYRSIASRTIEEWSGSDFDFLANLEVSRCWLIWKLGVDIRPCPKIRFWVSDASFVDTLLAWRPIVLPSHQSRLFAFTVASGMYCGTRARQSPHQI